MNITPELQLCLDSINPTTDQLEAWLDAGYRSRVKADILLDVPATRPDGGDFGADILTQAMEAKASFYEATLPESVVLTAKEAAEIRLMPYGDRTPGQSNSLETYDTLVDRQAKWTQFIETYTPKVAQTSKKRLELVRKPGTCRFRSPGGRWTEQWYINGVLIQIAGTGQNLFELDSLYDADDRIRLLLVGLSFGR